MKSRIKSLTVGKGLGILLVLWAWGNWLYRASTPESAVSIVRAEDSAADTVRVDATSVLPQILMYSLILVFLVLFGGYAVVRMVRQYRGSADRERAGPSASQDVWAMHELPDYDRDEDRVK